jgi:hypothetical protein
MRTATNERRVKTEIKIKKFEYFIDDFIGKIFKMSERISKSIENITK